MNRLSRALTALIILSALLILSGCAGQNELIPEPSLPKAEIEDSQPAPWFYLPLESSTAISLKAQGEPEVLELRFDRPGIWSIRPERFLTPLDGELRLEPIQTYGSGGLKTLDILILRFVPEKLPGYRLPAGEPLARESFFDAPREPLPVPEALVLVRSELLGEPLLLESSPGDASARRGVLSLEQISRSGVAPALEDDERELVDRVLNLGSAAESRRGFRSILFVPYELPRLESYPAGIELALSLKRIPEAREAWAQALEVRLPPRLEDGNPYPEVRIGDLGIFSGATPLLDPGIPRVSAEVYASSQVRKMNPDLNARFTPVVWEGSFNAYRDERRRFLFYPGVFSYIPGKHPDLSPEDVYKVTGMDQPSFDRALRGRSFVTLRREIYGAIPAFIAAADSPTELEIAFDSHPRLREQLRLFLEEPAYFLLLD